MSQTALVDAHRGWKWVLKQSKLIGGHGESPVSSETRSQQPQQEGEKMLEAW